MRWVTPWLSSPKSGHQSARAVAFSPVNNTTIEEWSLNSEVISAEVLKPSSGHLTMRTPDMTC
jgi:hypothetical protein